MTQTRVEILERMSREFAQAVPHNAALGLKVRDLDEGKASMELPYDARFVGDPRTGVLHGGVITALLDACCGAAVFMKLRQPVPIATLDLRIDYLKPARPPLAVLAETECFKVTRSVAFVRGFAFHEGEEEPIAAAAAAFMLNTQIAREGSFA